jgi:hypothetical protein
MVYALENMVIFEQLDKGKKQKIVHFNEPISCLTFNQNGNFVFIGTSRVSIDKNLANIYVLNTSTFKIIKVILFFLKYSIFIEDFVPPW